MCVIPCRYTEAALDTTMHHCPKHRRSPALCKDDTKKAFRAGDSRRKRNDFVELSNAVLTQCDPFIDDNDNHPYNDQAHYLLLVYKSPFYRHVSRTELHTTSHKQGRVSGQTRQPNRYNTTSTQQERTETNTPEHSLYPTLKMCRHQYLLYACSCLSPQPIYTGCPPDRCLGSYIDRNPKIMHHSCAACSYRTQQDAQRRAGSGHASHARGSRETRTHREVAHSSRRAAFDDGSNAARRESVRRWEMTQSRGLDRSRSTVQARNRPPQTRNHRYRARSISPPPLRHGSRSQRRNPSAEDELMRYSSEETEYTIRYNRTSGEWSSVASPRRRRHRPEGW